MTKIYVTGPKGRLGSSLVLAGAIPIHDNILKPATAVEDGAVIINCASATDVDRCETDEAYYGYAKDVNCWGVKSLADFHENARIFHLSTDYIYRGLRGPYNEDYLREDDLAPKGCSYGVTKFGGEMLAMNYPNVHIIRTTGLYGISCSKSTFLDVVLRDAEHGMEVTKELLGNQTYIPHLVEALMFCANLPVMPKILHIASRDVISRYDFALMIASVFGLSKKFIHPVTNKQVPGWVAVRPKKGGLKTNLARKLKVPIHTVLEGLQDAKNTLG